MLLYALASCRSWAAVPAEASTEELIPQDVSLWKESDLWEKRVAVHEGMGYEDNVLLSSSPARGSPFLLSGLDLTVFRLPLDGLEFSLAGTGEDVRYLRYVGLHNADDFLANTRVQKQIDDRWRTGFELKLVYLDQVLQTLASTGGLQTLKVMGETIAMRPYVRYDFTNDWWLQFQVPLSREWYRQPLDDDWKLGGEAVLGRGYGFHSQVTLTCGLTYVPYDTWPPLDAAGNTNVTSHARLAFWQPSAELRSEHHWDETQRWRSVTKLGFQYNQDNGGGYYNYYRYMAAEELYLRAKGWTIKATASVSYYDFPIQTIGIGEKLHVCMVGMGLKVERRLTEAFGLFAEYGYERSLSDDALDAYASDRVAAGATFEF